MIRTSVYWAGPQNFTSHIGVFSEAIVRNILLIGLCINAITIVCSQIGCN